MARLTTPGASGTVVRGRGIPDRVRAGTRRGTRLASQAGEQTIRLLCDESQRVSRIQLLFREEQRARTQEFVLRWSLSHGQSYREIVRQQYNFSPPGMTSEFEDYAVELAGVTALELRIVPDINHGDIRASIAEIRIA